MKRIILVVALAATAFAQDKPQPKPQCLLVTHEFVGYAFGGHRYHYVDAVNLGETQMKITYKGKDLEKLQKLGVRVVITRDALSSATVIENFQASCGKTQQ